jgi:integrase
VQRLKSALGGRSPKTVNNVLTVLSVGLTAAVEWGVIERVPCSIKLLKTSKSAASFYEFDEYERLVEAAQSDSLAYLVVLLGGEAELRCGEIMALEWTDIDLHKRQLSVARSEWKGYVTVQKGGGCDMCRSQSAWLGLCGRRDICADHEPSATRKASHSHRRSSRSWSAGPQGERTSSLVSTSCGTRSVRIWQGTRIWRPRSGICISARLRSIPRFGCSRRDRIPWRNTGGGGKSTLISSIS